MTKGFQGNGLIQNADGVCAEGDWSAFLVRLESLSSICYFFSSLGVLSDPRALGAALLLLRKDRLKIYVCCGM